MRIAFLLYNNMLATSHTNPYELFYAANQTLAASKGGRIGVVSKPVNLVQVAQSVQRINLPSGLSVMPDSYLMYEPFDLIYVPAMWRNPRPIVRSNPKIVEWLRWQYEHGALINSTGTGVWFSASAGILDGKSATTHWNYFERFAEDFPRVKLQRQHFITEDGSTYCAASVNALTDLTLHHVHRFIGHEVSDHLSNHFSPEVRQPFDKLSFNASRNTNHPDELVLQVQLWMQNNLSKNQLNMNSIASSFGMSSRNFNRRFKEATNLTPIQYLQHCRSDAAKELLQTTNLSIKEIAYRVGYLDVSYFTKLFKQLTRLSPKEYRRTMRATLFSST